MIKHLRMLGVVMIFVGIAIAVSYIIEPLREVFSWYWLLPVPLQIGFGVAGIGMIVLIISLLAERVSDREADRALKDETPKSSQQS